MKADSRDATRLRTYAYLHTVRPEPVEGRLLLLPFNKKGTSFDRLRTNGVLSAISASHPKSDMKGPRDQPKADIAFPQIVDFHGSAA